MEMKKLQVWVSKEVDLKLRQLIAQKYGKYQRGLLSYEVESALKEWIALHTKAQASLHMEKLNPNPKVYVVWQEVKSYLSKNYYADLKPSQQVNIIHLREAVKAVRGGDKRTVEKWLNLFREFKLVKHITGAIWEIL
jgi:hypothetical protein